MILKLSIYYNMVYQDSSTLNKTKVFILKNYFSTESIHWTYKRRYPIITFSEIDLKNITITNSLFSFKDIVVPDFFEYVHECSYIYYDLKSPADEIVKSLEIKQINYIDEISKILLNNIFFNNQSTLCLHFLLSRFGLNLSKYTNSFKNNYYVFKGLTPPLELNATKIINNLSNLDKYNSNNFDPGLRQQILKLLVTSPLKSSNLFCSKSILDLPDYKQHNDFIQGRLLNFLENHNLNWLEIYKNESLIFKKQKNLFLREPISKNPFTRDNCFSTSLFDFHREYILALSHAIVLHSDNIFILFKKLKLKKNAEQYFITLFSILDIFLEINFFLNQVIHYFSDFKDAILLFNFDNPFYTKGYAYKDSICHKNWWIFLFCQLGAALFLFQTFMTYLINEIFFNLSSVLWTSTEQQEFYNSKNNFDAKLQSLSSLAFLNFKTGKISEFFLIPENEVVPLFSILAKYNKYLLGL